MVNHKKEGSKTESPEYKIGIQMKYLFRTVRPATGATFQGCPGVKIVVWGMVLMGLICHSGAQAYVFPHETGPVKLTWSGYINTDASFDTRQTFSFREGLTLATPLPRDVADDGVDTNKYGSFNWNSVASSLSVRIDGPPLFCSQKTYAVIGMDFRGVDDATMALLRFYPAYVNLDWQKISLLLGQCLTPLLPPGINSRRVMYDGSPWPFFDTDPSLPQVRVTFYPESGYQNPDQIIIACVGRTRTTPSAGPDGPLVIYARNGLMPAFHMQGRKYVSDALCLGLCVEAKRLIPRLRTTTVTGKHYAEHESVNGVVVSGYGCMQTDDFALKIKGSYVVNGGDYEFVSGYAVKTRDPVTDRCTYTPLRCFACWGEADIFPRCAWSPGLFIGFTQNLGASEHLYSDPVTHQPIVYSYAADLDYLVSLIPRLWHTRDNFAVGFELDLSWASFGALDSYGRPDGTKPVFNARLLGSCFYRF
jgi:hypothetical protein